LKRTDLVLTPRGLRAFGRLLPCSIGRGGLTTRKREGDGATPRGTHRLIGMLYRADRLARPADWALPIKPGDLWCDDPSSEEYNMMVRAPFAAGHERLRRADPLYDAILLTDWNWPYAIKGRGSAIFIHQWRRPGYPTEGCIALSRTSLSWLLPRIRHSTGLIIG